MARSLDGPSDHGLSIPIEAPERGRTLERPLRVMVLGLRGIVDVQGGIETHARNLYPLLVRLGCEVEILQRSAYFRGRRLRRRCGVRLSYLWAPPITAVETAVHTLLGVLYAAIKRPDILHLHAVGPAFLTPLARLLGLRVVVTHHGADYLREKWGPIARRLLEAGEWAGMRGANGRIVVSKVLQERMREKYGVGAALIPNGAPRAGRVATTDTVSRFGLRPRRYVLYVARMDRGKRQLDLVDAFEAARPEGWKLALVGEVNARDAYTRHVIERARRNPDIVLTGFQRGRALRELYSHCAVFVLPSSAEGHPIALLEALSYGAPVLSTAIPENMAIPIPPECFFPVGDTQALAQRIASIARGDGPAEAGTLQQLVRTRYSWRRAAQLTRAVYDDVLSGG
ncbi:MAG TPA: glycosyltransferase family 4 protein [Gammaproteobacteria bacterium]